MRDKRSKLQIYFCVFSAILLEKQDNEVISKTRLQHKSNTSMDIKVKKMLCGKEHIIKIENEKLIGKTLLITDLEKKDSIKIQQLGIGIGKLYGCGIFCKK